MTNADAVQKQLQKVTSARSESAVFVRMDGRLAVVNIGTATVTVPCVGFYPPLPGMPVRVDWVNGSPAVTGPVAPLNPIGIITATGTPRATVEVDGVPYTLPVMDSYAAVVGDEVAINWNIGVIQGKLAAVDVPEPPGDSGGGPSGSYDIVVRAAGSGRYQGGWWGDSDPWASNNNVGAWVYGDRVRAAIAGTNLTGIWVYLPLIEEVGNCAIGVHDLAAIGGPGPSLVPGSLITLPLGQRNGWLALTPALGDYLSVGGRGVGVLAPGGGYTRWRGVQADGLSGALRLAGNF